MQYLTLQESVRRLRAAGVDARERTLRQWVRDQRVRDVWILGSHTYIYEQELNRLIAQETGA